MKRHGLLCLAALLLAAPPAFSQASNLSNCKYYAKVAQDFEQGLPYCQKAVVENPDDPEARFVGAWCMAEMGQLEEAWKSFSWLLERKDSDDKNTRKFAKDAGARVDHYYARFFNNGLEVLNAEDYQAAAESFRWATQIDPRKTGAYLNLGFTQTQLQDLDGALESFSKALEMAPGDSTSLIFYWDALRQKLGDLRATDEPDSARIAGVTGELRDTLEQILEKDPGGPSAADAHLQLAELDLDAGDRTAGLEHLRQAIELDEESIVDLVNVGIRFYSNDDFEAAGDALELVLEYVDDTTDEVWHKTTWVLGLAQFELENFEAAVGQFEKLLEQNPDDMEVLPKAGVAARKAGKTEQGDRYLIHWEELKEAQIVGTDGSAAE